MVKIYKGLIIVIIHCVLLHANFSIFAQSVINPILSSNLQIALDNQFAKYNIKGVVAAISMPNGDIWYGASGTSNGTDTIKSDMLFGIGSNTKTFTATLIMMLAEDNLLKLEDSIYHWIPSFQFVDSSITINQLLNHTSGLYNYTDHPAMDDSVMSDLARFWKPEEVLATFMQAPYFEKGTDYHYANTNYLILGMIIKAVTGSTVSNLLHSRILDPLGLTHTYLDQEDSLMGEVAHVWYDIFDNGITYDLVLYNIDRTATYSSMWTAGAMFSTAEDMLKWSKSLFLGKIVSDYSLNMMLDFLPGDGYGLGVAQYFISGRELWGHGGDVIYKSFLLYSPLDTISIILLCNDDEMTYSQRIDIAEAVLDAYIAYQSGMPDVSPKAVSFHLFPNPTARETTIEYSLKQQSDIGIDIFDITGKYISRICYEKQYEGEHRIEWKGKSENGEYLNPGMYIFRISIDNNTIEHIPLLIIN